MNTDTADKPTTTASASQNCVHCNTPIHLEGETWVDATSGEGCTDDNGNEQLHTASAQPAPNKAQKDLGLQDAESPNESTETDDALSATNLHGDKWTGETQDGVYVYLDQQGNLYESKERPAYRLPITINRYSEQIPPHKAKHPRLRFKDQAEAEAHADKLAEALRLAEATIVRLQLRHNLGSVNGTLDVARKALDAWEKAQ